MMGKDEGFFMENTMKNKKIAIIGVGAIGKAFAKGLVNSGIDPENIILSDKASTNRQAINRADWIIIAVKPLMVKVVMKDIKDLLTSKLIISIAAGVNVVQLQNYSENNHAPVIRLMPNIPVSVNQGVIGLFSNNYVGSSTKKEIVSVFSGLGLLFEVKNEELLDTITLIAGCSPALVLHFVELLTQYAARHGLSESEANKIMVQTLKGTADYLVYSKLSTKKLIHSIATKGGITETILKSFKKDELDTSFQKSLKRGHTKIKSLSKSLL